MIGYIFKAALPASVYECTCVVGRTDAGVVVDSIDAGGVVLTVVVFTVVWVYLTTLALESWRTHAATHTHTHTHTHKHKHTVRYKMVTGATLLLK